MPESIVDPSVKHTTERSVQRPVGKAVIRPSVQSALAPVTQSAKQPAGQPRTLANRIMWLVILWCAGFGATFLFVLPFHLLVQWAVRR
ncbi:hypothetical protein [Paraburkholderia rhizosphaerae]|uniref:DUF2474 family protein n=1 Tax=Paraburkholderia rhizosphaerae TaxID=480658 RepID=A0A4V3HE71_9BURK|nr:hypothetical protein [Paraburkholderia rhizosphaerae]TDY44493.1 hypothetical protein BX592_116141 [Paraburkholderia rhizosphaerae]